MTSDAVQTIYPCPFSKGYGIPAGQAWLLLKIFFVYRLVIGSLFVLLFHSRFGPSLLGVYDAQLYGYVSTLYLLIAILSGPYVFLRLIGYAHQTQGLIFIDIVGLTLIMHASGGVTSGIGMLLAISIAVGGMLIGGLCAMLFAALASLAILTEQIYAIQTHAFETTTLTYAGMLGASFFTIAFLSYILAKRTEQTALLAREHARTISRLQELNRHIIRHLQAGILIVDPRQALQLCNEAALELLGLRQAPARLNDINPILQQAFELWLHQPEQDFAIVPLPDHSELQVRFSLLATDNEQAFMILLEDVGLYNQRLQQSKLASLGRLTASIAHEIRNPLGAISHAGQLLSEAPQLSPEDRRLTQIIQTHSQRVNHIINDILNLSRRQPSKKEKIDLGRWLPQTLHDLQNEPELAAGRFELEFATSGQSVFCYMDAGHLKQILTNLCSNALKYGCPAAGTVTIRVEITPRTLDINVIDPGSGIEAEVLQHLFEPFFTTSNSGSGLGLYICRELAELNQANLRYALTEERHTCFTLSLPHPRYSTLES